MAKITISAIVDKQNFLKLKKLSRTVSEYNERGAKTEQMGSDGTNFLSLNWNGRIQLPDRRGRKEERREKSNAKSSLYISSQLIPQTNSPIREGESKRR
jgi:hypothetical protein